MIVDGGLFPDARVLFTNYSLEALIFAMLGPY
jgi:hypothetical protein